MEQKTTWWSKCKRGHLRKPHFALLVQFLFLPFTSFAKLLLVDYSTRLTRYSQASSQAAPARQPSRAPQSFQTSSDPPPNSSSPLTPASARPRRQLIWKMLVSLTGTFEGAASGLRGSRTIKQHGSRERRRLLGFFYGCAELGGAWDDCQDEGLHPGKGRQVSGWGRGWLAAAPVRPRAGDRRGRSLGVVAPTPPEGFHPNSRLRVKH